jgi:hypothetical protein
VHGTTNAKNIPDSGFAGDDGSADPRLAAALARHAAEGGAAGGGAAEAEREVLTALAGARLLVPIVVLGEAEIDEHGHKREKSSDMAVPTIEAPDGRRGLPAFTSLASLQAWRADARPAPVPTRQAIEAAWSERAEALLIDLAGPHFFELSGPAMRVLAQGRTPGDILTDPQVAAALRELLAGQAGVARAHLLPSQQADALLALVLAPGAGPEVPQAVAAALAEDERLRALLLRGLDLAVVPPATREPETPFFSAEAASR